MKTEEIVNQFEQVYSGKPWYGNSMLEIFNNIPATDAVKKLTRDGHSIVELVYHMITWRYFVIKQIRGDTEFDVSQNDKNDWREIHYNKKNLWNDALSEFDKIHKQLISELNNFEEAILQTTAPLRNYTYEFLLTGLIQHDMYHLGQISFIKNSLSGQK